METLKNILAGILIHITNIRNMREQLEYTVPTGFEME